MPVPACVHKIFCTRLRLSPSPARISARTRVLKLCVSRFQPAPRAIYTHRSRSGAHRRQNISAPLVSGHAAHEICAHGSIPTARLTDFVTRLRELAPRVSI